MDNESIKVFAELAQSLSVSGLLLYFAFYFKAKAEEHSQALIDHLEHDIEEVKKAID